MARYRAVCFTLNNPTDPIAFDVEEMQYLVYQKEIGANGTPHFQGYCEFKKQKRLAAVKLLLAGPPPASCHVERRRGTPAEAAAYCKKDDTRAPGETPVEFGEMKAQGKRMDLEAFKDEVMAGKRKRELIDDHCGIIARYPKFYDQLTMMNRPERSEEMVVTLLIGGTGLGKTRRVMDAYGSDSDFYVAPLNNGTMWYDTFDGHRRVLLDDFAGAASHISLTSLLRLLDRYPVLVPTKGSHTWWLPVEVFVTTNIPPRDWYKWENRGEQYKALARRFHKVVEYKEGEEPLEREADWWQIHAPMEAVYTTPAPHPPNAHVPHELVLAANHIFDL